MGRVHSKIVESQNMNVKRTKWHSNELLTFYEKTNNAHDRNGFFILFYLFIFFFVYFLVVYKDISQPLQTSNENHGLDHCTVICRWPDRCFGSVSTRMIWRNKICWCKHQTSHSLSRFILVCFFINTLVTGNLRMFTYVSVITERLSNSQTYAVFYGTNSNILQGFFSNFRVLSPQSFRWRAILWADWTLWPSQLTIYNPSSTEHVSLAEQFT